MEKSRHLPPGAATRHPDLGTPYTQYSILYTLIFGQLINRSTSSIICPLPSVICHLSSANGLRPRHLDLTANR